MVPPFQPFTPLAVATRTEWRHIVVTCGNRRGVLTGKDGPRDRQALLGGHSPRLEEDAAHAGVRRAVLPAERPCPLEEAVDWARGMLEEAWFSAYQVDAEEGLVYLKVWEYGDDEPDWGDVRRQARPGLPYRFTASPAALSYCDAVVDALVRMGLNEADALEILNRRHGELPWLAKDEIDPMRDDFPEWWAEQLAGRSG